MHVKTKGYLIILIVAVFACYFNALRSGFVWDDINNVVNSQRLDKAEGFREIFLSPSASFYRPLSYLSLKLDFILWGKNHFGFHLSNLILHILNVIALFFIAKTISRSEITGFFTALLFAAHPVHTEAVAYVSGRSDMIAGIFMMLSFYMLIIFYSQNKTGNIYLNSSLILYIAALLSKESALLFPGIIMIYLMAIVKKSFIESFKQIIPFIIITIFFLAFRQNLIAGELSRLEFKINFTNIFKSYLFYFKFLFFPVNLHMQHNISESVFIAGMNFIISAVMFLTVIFVLRKNTEKKYFNFALGWFLLGLLPFAGMIAYSADLAEHWLYIPSFGIFFLIGNSIAIKNSKRVKALGYVVVLILGILTFRQNAVWIDDVTFYKYTLKFHPENEKLHYNLGNAYLRRKMDDKAQEKYKRALQIKPDYAFALNNLAIVFENKGENAKAYQLYKKSRDLDPEGSYHKKNITRFELIPSAYAEPAKESFDNYLYAQILSEYLDDGWVNYKQLKKNSGKLDAYLHSAAVLKPEVFESMPRDEKMAFYINVYNALTIRAILDNYPVKSIKKIPGVWDKLKFTVAGQDITLDKIEHGILRPKFKDPRVHFALVCAARGCPRLTEVPYEAENIDKMLDDAGRKFLRDKTRNRLDREKNILYLSSIFKWFKGDFGDVTKFISKYLQEDDVRFINQNNPRKKYIYNWDLNERK